MRECNEQCRALVLRARRCRVSVGVRERREASRSGPGVRRVSPGGSPGGAFFWAGTDLEVNLYPLAEKGRGPTICVLSCDWLLCALAFCACDRPTDPC